ncbi:MlaD family protein [Cruoricaptor ignavus]|uniref:MlaD family protein n=1 Tax=Cruoricaptor ignavus TaxID=1118202 RepID=UPI00370DAF62
MKFSKELKAGLIAVLSILGFVFMYRFMSGKHIFSTDDVYYAKFDNVEGLSQSSPVSINGMKVGQVEEITPITDKANRLFFILKLRINDDFKFARNSTVEVFEPGFMAGKEMRINLGTGSLMAKDGDTLAGHIKSSALNDLSTQLEPVKDQFQVVMANLDSLLISTNQVVDARNREEIRQLLQNMNRAVASFETAGSGANTLFTNNDPRLQQVLDNASLATLSARTALDRYYRVADEIDVQKLNRTIDQLSVTSEKLNNVVTNIQQGNGSLGKLAYDEELYQNLNRTSNHLDSLILDVKRNPKRYVNFSVFGKNSN